MVEGRVDERLSAKPLGDGGPRRVARVAALEDRDDPACDDRREQERDPGEQAAQTSVGAPGAFGRALGGRGSPTNARSIALTSIA